MQTKATVRLLNGVYHAEISLGDEPALSAAESEAINQFGPVSVEVGGSVETPGQTVVLPSNSINIPGGLPIKQTFDLADYTEANALAQAWVTLVKNRISVALNAVLVKDAGDLGTTEENVLPTPGDREEDELQTSDWMQLNI